MFHYHLLPMLGTANGHSPFSKTQTSAYTQKYQLRHLLSLWQLSSIPPPPPRDYPRLSAL